MGNKAHLWAWIQFSLILVIGTILLFKVLQFTIISVPLILGIVIYYSAKPTINYLVRFGLSVSASRNIVIIVSLVITTILIYIVPSWFYREIVALKGKAPLVIENLKEIIISSQEWINSHLPQSFSKVDILSYLSKSGEKLIPSIFSNLPTTITNIIMILAMTPVFGYFFIKDAKIFKEFFFNITPNRYYEMSVVIVQKVNDQVGNFIIGRIIEAIAVGIIVLIPTAIAGVEGALLIAIIVSITNVIPYIGPIIGTVIGAILGFASVKTSFTPVWIILISCGAAQLIDAVILSPVIVGKSMNLHPLVVFTTFIVSAQLFGTLGLIVGVPIVAVYVITFQSFKKALKGVTTSYR